MGTAFNSFALLNPDLGVYATIAAAQDHPELFERDPFLSNEKNLNSFHMVHVPLLQVLNKVFGNYGTACAFLLPFIIFLHLTGYYFLGISIFKEPRIALLASLIIFVPVQTLYDFWGLILDALPRFLYQSLLPFVLVFAIRYGKNPKWWSVILGGIGVLNYVHPLSTPPWAMAIALGLWIAVPGMPALQKTVRMGFALLILLFSLFPFLMNYITSTIIETSRSISYDRYLPIVTSHFFSIANGDFLSSITAFFVGLPENTIGFVWYFTWLFGLWGLLFGLSRRVSDDNDNLRQIAMWMGGILLVGGVVPTVERVIFAYLKQMPPELEMLRTLRYLVPLILLNVVYGLQLITDLLQKRSILTPTSARNLFFGATFAFFILWGVANSFQRPDIRSVLRQNIFCWSRGHLVCDLPQSSMDFIDMMGVLRDKTPVGARVFSEGQEVAIRYYALRPLVFTYKDGAPLAYTDQNQLLVWHTMYEEMDRLSLLRRFSFRHKAFIRGITELAESANSDYLLIQEPYNDKLYYPEQLELVYTNQHYSLFRIVIK